MQNPPPHWPVVGVACIGAFIGQLDASIVQLALPTLKDAFGATVDEVRWVAIAYLLAFAACLPVFGRVCEIVGRKLFYVTGFALFSVSSMLCGSATDLEWLIAFRTLQGMGGSLLGANSIAILVRSVPESRRNHAIGVFTAAQAIGVSVGPVAGGLLLDSLDWRWIFWASIPFGLAGFVLAWLVVPRSSPASDERLDGYGALLLMLSLVFVVLALTQLSVWSPTSPRMLLCILGAIVFSGLFVRQERKARWPVVDLALFAGRGFVNGIVGVTLGYALLYGMLFLMAFALVHGLHNTATLAGIKLAIIPAVLGLVAPLGIALSGRLHPRHLGVASMAICFVAIMTLAFIAFGPGSLVPRLVALALFGLGLGLFMAPNSHATVAAAPSSRSGTAGALVNLARVFGSCIGVASASSIMSWQLHQHGGSRPVDSSPVSLDLLDAVEGSLIMLGVFTLIVAAAALMGPRTPPASKS
jgi:EmrB/QacA subfamily drug resistance transporter